MTEVVDVFLIEKFTEHLDFQLLRLERLEEAFTQLINWAHVFLYAVIFRN